jgi:hypothetical protein
MAGESRNTVFISYPIEDFTIAKSVNMAINAMPGNKLDVFLDQDHLSAGQRIPDTIQQALRKTIYFVAIGTNVLRRNFDWCGLELGFYQGSYDGSERRETCLYDLSFPDLFAETHNFRVKSLRVEHRDQFVDDAVPVNNSDIYNFLIGVADINAELHPPPDKVGYYNDIPAWADSHATSITEAFFTALQTRVENTWYPQGRLEFSIPKGDFYKDTPPDMPPDTTVTLSGSMYNIFSTGVPDNIRPMRLEKFLEFLRDNTGNDILARIILDIAVSALPSRADAKGDYIYQAPNQLFYRVLLVRHSVYGNRRRDMVFNLIRTLDKVQGGDARTTALVAGIVRGSKYRSLFIEAGAKYDSDRLASLTLEDATVEIGQMLQDIDKINADAASDGLADYNALLDLLGSPLETRTLYEKWWVVFPPMEAAAKQFVKGPTHEHLGTFFQAFRPFVDVSRQNNTVFLRLCLDAYRKLLNAGPMY